jgi:hypothetical protein
VGSPPAQSPALVAPHRKWGDRIGFWEPFGGRAAGFPLSINIAVLAAVPAQPELTWQLRTSESLMSGGVAKSKPARSSV